MYTYNNLEVTEKQLLEVTANAMERLMELLSEYTKKGNDSERYQVAAFQQMLQKLNKLGYRANILDYEPGDVPELNNAIDFLLS